LTARSAETIGVLGGSFDPIHFGHLTIARCAQRHFGLNTVSFIPANVQPHKQLFGALPDHRLAMLRLAIVGNPSFSICDWEIGQGGVSYTVNTLAYLKEVHRNSTLCFIIGADNLIDILTWHDYQAIVKMVTLCVACRPGYSLVTPPELMHADIQFFPSPPLEISATTIRARLFAGESCADLIPAAVLEYISTHSLYRIGGKSPRLLPDD
jgi:nicotinate-nucleotide adenylyltransferase